MLKDLKSGRGVEVIEPTIKTDDPNDPVLDRYRACEDHWDGRPPPPGGLDSLYRLGHRGFRLYRIDLDRNPANGVEELLAADADMERVASIVDFAIGFSEIDLDECKFKNFAPVFSPTELGVLIRYKRYYRVLQLKSAREEDKAHHLTVWKFTSHNSHHNTVPSCSWHIESMLQK